MDRPPDANIEPTREVLRRIYMGFGSCSFADNNPKILKRADELAETGWLIKKQSYPCAGLNYTLFRASERLNVQALKHL